MRQLAFLRTIQGRMMMAQGAIVVVLIAISVVATLQFGSIGRLVGTVSDSAEALMRLSHALDLATPTTQAFGAGYSAGNDKNARSKFDALAEDVAMHSTRALALINDDSERQPLLESQRGLTEVRGRLRKLDTLAEEERDVALIESEETLGDAFSALQKAKLAASHGMETRLKVVKREIKRPVQLFWLAAGIGGLVTLGVSLFLRRRVSRPIAVLGSAVRALAGGPAQSIPIESDDEIGGLGGAFNAMSATITERTRSLKLVLDSVGEGLVTCDLSGRVFGEPSARAVTWFGDPAGSPMAAEYFGGSDQAWTERFSIGFGQLVADLLPFELCADQMPSEVTRDGRTLQLHFRPVMADGMLQCVLIVVSDVTEERARVHKEREARDVYALSSFALRDPADFAEFTREIQARLSRAQAGEHVMLELHTVKGATGVVGCELFSEAVHDCESAVLDHPEDRECVGVLVERFRALCESVERVLGQSAKEMLVIPRAEYDRLIGLLARDASAIARATMLAQSWSMHRIEHSFDRLAKVAARSAARQDKRVQVVVQGHALCLPRGELDQLWNTLDHLVRNAVTHGLEGEVERQAAGKNQEGKLTLRAELANSMLRLTIADDGKGIDWQALYARAGVSPSDVTGIELLAREGVSTAGELTQLAGRGVGMSAVYRAVLEVGGEMTVQSEPGKGTSFEIRVPVGEEAYVAPLTTNVPPAMRESLRTRAKPIHELG